LNQFEKHNISSTQVTQKYQTLVLMPRLWLEFLGVASLAVIMVLMTLNGKNPSEMLATMGLICAAAFRMLPSANRVVNAVQQLSYGLAVVDTLASELALNGLQKGEASLECEFLDSLQARSLSFRYENIDRLALDSVSFSLKKGESLGIVGASGSGKSTLVDVLLGLLTPSAGKLLIDGKCYASAIGAWQRLIGYVPQSIYLTDDTLRRNIAFGIEEEAIEEKAVTEALKAAQLLEFVQELPEGLETRVGERGIRLSGGQRQRIGIARALYHDPDVLVLDEATSALDANTEKGVMSAVSALQGRKTIIIIAHRLSTVEQCDVLMRMEAGKVISKGSYIQVINSGSKNIESDKLINRK